MGNKKQTVKNAKSKEYYVVRNNSGNITNIIFPNTTQFGLDNSLSASVVFSVDAIPDQDAVRSLGSSAKQWKDLYVSEGTIFLGGARISLSDGGKIQIRDQGAETDVVISDIDGGTVDNASVISAIGFTPARVDLSNVTGATGRSALGISDHTTGSISDLFGNLTAGRVTTSLGFTPAQNDLGNVTGATGRSALGIQDHVTGTLTAVFTNAPDYLRNSSVTLSKSGGQLTFSNGSPVSLTFTKSDVDLGNVEDKSPAQLASDINLTGKFLDKTDPSSARGVLGISDHVTGSIGDLFSNLTAGRVTTSLGFTPAQNDLGNVTGATGRSALGISDHVTGSLTDVFNNAPASLRNSNITLTKSGGTLTFNNGSGNSSLSFAKGDVGLGSVENKSSSDIRGEITSGDVTGPLGYTPVDPASPPANLLNSNVTRGTLGISDHVTGSISDLFDNLTPARVTSGLGFTPVNTDLSNAPSTILNSSVSRSTLGISDYVTGSLTTMFRSAGRTSGQTAQSNFTITKAFATQPSLFAEDMEVVPGGAGADSAGAENNICILKPHQFVNGVITTTNFYFVTASDGVKINANNDISGLRNITATGDMSVGDDGEFGGGLVVGSTALSANTGQLRINQSSDTQSCGLELRASNEINPWRIFNSGNSSLSDGGGTSFGTYALVFNDNGTNRGALINNSNVGAINFTGQHRCEDLDNSLAQAEAGLIVTSTGDYNNLVEADRPTINSALPIVRLSSKRYQKSCFGVLSDKEDTENSSQRLYTFGNFISYHDKEGDVDRLIINSLGEGAIWITNINGNLENGDYITTCEIPGYGMKQDDDILHNYTVAKITQDCDFQLSGSNYQCEELIFSGSTYRRAFVGCTYHCG